MLKDKTIIVGITGCIAAYKSAAMVSRLKDLGAEVWVAMTKEAAALVGPLTFRTLSGNPVVTDLFSQEILNTPVPHISLAEKADLIVIAPCTANVIGKLANGIADDALTTITMASNAPKLLAPAMNPNMWNNPAVQENVEKLKRNKFELIGPAEGKLACGKEDVGRMTEPEEILIQVVSLLGSSVDRDLEGKKVLVTAGGTREAIDPVRFISNRSSGKMGYAIAQAAYLRGADVTLISAPSALDAPSGVKIINVESAKEMHEAVMENQAGQNVIVMAAAVADYRPAISFWQKLKKDGKTYALELLETVDILEELGKRKNGSLLVGFAAETENHVDNALEKLHKKNLDLIVANDAAAFDNDVIKFSIVDRDLGVQEYDQQPKSQAANIILDKISAFLRL